MDIKPKTENLNTCFHYTVTDEQIETYQLKNAEEIFI